MKIMMVSLFLAVSCCQAGERAFTGEQRFADLNRLQDEVISFAEHRVKQQTCFLTLSNSPMPVMLVHSPNMFSIQIKVASGVSTGKLSRTLRPTYATQRPPGSFRETVYVDQDALVALKARMSQKDVVLEDGYHLSCSDREGKQIPEKFQHTLGIFFKGDLTPVRDVVADLTTQLFHAGPPFTVKYGEPFNW